MDSALARVVIVMLLVAAAGCHAPQPGPTVPTYDGAGLYRGHCASCHGQHGAGDGPLAGSLLVPPTDLRTLSTRNDGRFPRATVTAQIDGRAVRAEHGSREMPVWGWQFFEPGETEPDRRSQARIEALVNHVASIQLQGNPR